MEKNIIIPILLAFSVTNSEVSAGLLWIVDEISL